MTLRDRGADPIVRRIENHRRRAGKVREDVVIMAHGGGGKAMRDLIDDVIVGALGSGALEVDEDQARFELAGLALHGDRLAMTTDSYVVTPLMFPGGDIGKLAVNGTVNDLAVSGARPLYLTCGLILEEGLPIATLRAVLESMKRAADHAQVRITTGDTKVVPKGKADQLFINTTGIGVIPKGIDVRCHGVRAGDAILVNGHLGDHGAAILIARGELKLGSAILSDSAPLHGLVSELAGAVDIHAMRDITRGGLAAVLNELALSSEVGIVVDGNALPVRPEVAGITEILGLDPVHLANEGKLVVAVPAAQASRALEVMRGHPQGASAAVIAACRPSPPGIVTLDTGFGGERILDMLVGEPLPRIC